MTFSEAEKILWRKEMGTHSSILDWEIPWTEEPGGIAWDCKKVRHDWETKQQQQNGSRGYRKAENN